MVQRGLFERSGAYAVLNGEQCPGGASTCGRTGGGSGGKSSQEAVSVSSSSSTGSGSTAAASPKNYSTRHDQALRAAMAFLSWQIFMAGGDPSHLHKDYPVPGGSKNRTGNKGRADIVYDDGETLWVWEVKIIGQWRKAQAEADWYVSKLNAAGEKAHVGWPIGGWFPVGNGDEWAGTAPGAVVYRPGPGKPGPRLRWPRPVPVTVPDRIPIRVDVPYPAPEPLNGIPQGEPGGGGGGGGGISLPDPPGWLVPAGLIGGGILACATGVGCTGGLVAIGTGVAVAGAG